MSNANMLDNKVYQYITTAPKAAAQRLMKAKSYAEFIEIAGAAGVALTRADVEAFQSMAVATSVAPVNHGRELSDAELSAVAGGASFAVASGSGGGRRSGGSGGSGSGTQYQPLCDILPPPTSDPFLCGDSNKTVFQPGCP